MLLLKYNMLQIVHSQNRGSKKTSFLLEVKKFGSTARGAAPRAAPGNVGGQGAVPADAAADAAAEPRLSVGLRGVASTIQKVMSLVWYY